MDNPNLVNSKSNRDNFRSLGSKTLEGLNMKFSDSSKESSAENSLDKSGEKQTEKSAEIKPEPKIREQFIKAQNEINDSSDSSTNESDNLAVLEKSTEIKMQGPRKLQESDMSSLKSSKEQKKVEIKEPAAIYAPEPIRTQNSIHAPAALKPEQSQIGLGIKSDSREIRAELSSNKSNSRSSYKFWPWSPYIKRGKSTFIEQLTENVNSRSAAKNNNEQNDINIPIGVPRQFENDEDYYQRVDMCDLTKDANYEVRDDRGDRGERGERNDIRDDRGEIGDRNDIRNEKNPDKSQRMPTPPHYKPPPNTPTSEMRNLLNESVIENRKRTDLAASKSNNSSTVRNALNKSTDSGRSTPLAKKITKEAASLTFLDIPFHQTNSEMTKTEKDLLILIMAKAGGAKQYHQKKMGVCKFYNKLLGILSQILSILAGSTGIGSLITSTSSGEVSAAALAVVTIISLLAAIFATLQRGFGFENGAISHKQSCTEYSHIVTKIARFLATPDLDRKEIEIFTNNIVLELGIAESNED